MGKLARMVIAAGCAAAHGHLELLKWLTGEREEGCASGSTAAWGRYILAAASRGGHLHIIEWAHRAGYPNNSTKKAWARAANLARAAAESVRAGQRRPRKMSWERETAEVYEQDTNEVEALVRTVSLSHSVTPHLFS